MTDPGDEKSGPSNEPSGSGPEKQPEVTSPPSEDLYSVSEPEPDPPDLAVGETMPVWFAATAEGQREGPLSLAEMKQRIASGRLTGENLVWKGGMQVWTAAKAVP